MKAYRVDEYFTQVLENQIAIMHGLEQLTMEHWPPATRHLREAMERTRTMLHGSTGMSIHEPGRHEVPPLQATPPA